VSGPADTFKPKTPNILPQKTSTKISPVSIAKPALSPKQAELPREQEIEAPLLNIIDTLENPGPAEIEPFTIESP
jgi:hypothetical protein